MTAPPTKLGTYPVCYAQVTHPLLATASPYFVDCHYCGEFDIDQIAIHQIPVLQHQEKKVCKRLNNELLVLQEIRTGRKKMALLSMWKRPLSAPVAPHLNASTAEASAEGEPPAPFGEQAHGF
ncbi:MAG: hypothetical protein QM533_02115 [Cytophagales bacterium]|nr:hypothetical protein [Cytophagales bacterium]